MRAQDSNVYRIHEFCVQSGMIQGDQPSAVAKTEASSQLAIMDRSNSSLGVEQPEARGGSGSGAAEPATLFLSDAETARGVAGEVSLDAMVNYGSCYQWGLLPVSTLELLLRACLPQIFTVVVVKAMCVRGARKKNQAMLASYLEHVTNLLPNGNVPKNMSLRELMAVVISLQKDVGGRGSDLVLPADWLAQGVYKAFVTSEGFLMVAHRFLQKSVRVTGKCRQEQRFYIEHNHSEIRATLHEHDGLFQQPLYQLFSAVQRHTIPTAKDLLSDEEFVETPCKRRRADNRELNTIRPKPPPQSDVPPVPQKPSSAAQKAAAQLDFKPTKARK